MEASCVHPRACTACLALPLATHRRARAPVTDQAAPVARDCGRPRTCLALSGGVSSRVAHTQEHRRLAGIRTPATRCSRGEISPGKCSMSMSTFQTRLRATTTPPLAHTQVQRPAQGGQLCSSLHQRKARASVVASFMGCELLCNPSPGPWQGTGTPATRRICRPRRRCCRAPAASQEEPGKKPAGSGIPEGDQREVPGTGLRVSFFEQKQKGSALPRKPVEDTSRDVQAGELGLDRESDFKSELVGGGGVGLAARGTLPDAEVLPAATDLATAMRQLDGALEADDLSTALGRLRGLNAPVLDTFELPNSNLNSNSNSAQKLPAGSTPAAYPQDRSWGTGNGTVFANENLRGLRPLGLFQERAAQVLDLALPEGDMGQVSRAYEWLGQVGVLRAFGNDKESLLTAEPRLVTPDTLRKLSGLQASQLSPKKWGSSGALGPLAAIALFSALVNNGVDVRPLALVLLVGAVLDSVYLGGAAQAQVLSLWPGHRERVMVHEAGHVLVAYLLGCPVRGVILDAFAAMDLGIQGQAGTQFWDPTFDLEVKANKLSGASIDRYSVVLFAGVAAEALVYGEAEGGESDENLFKALVGELQPPWPPAKVSNQARWAVLQAYTLIRQNKKALDAVVAALKEGKKMGDIALAIESSVGR